jgi:hypothetical protein
MLSRIHVFTFSRCHVVTFSRTHEAGGAVVNALERVVQRSVHPELGDEQPGVILEPGNDNTFLFLNVSHVCPEPVLVERSVSVCTNGEKKGHFPAPQTRE